jgi:mRNA-degrading endonuclease toxin of MazEF toxin-antitoxin module
MRRGDIVIVAFAGDFGKPRPAVIVQSDYLNDTRATILLCPFTSELAGAPADPHSRDALARERLAASVANHGGSSLPRSF